MGYANLGAAPSILSPAQLKALLAKRKAAQPAPVKVQVAPPPGSPFAALNLFKPKQAPTPMQTAAPLVSAAAAPVVGPIAAAIPPVVDAISKPSPLRIRVPAVTVLKVPPKPSTVPPAVPVTRPAPVLTTTTTNAPTSGGGKLTPELYDTDGSPINQAAIDASVPSGLVEQVKSLPPLVLASIAGAILFLLSRRS